MPKIKLQKMNLHKIFDKFLIFFLYFSFMNLCVCLKNVTIKYSIPPPHGKPKKVNKIFGGRLATIDQFPSLVAIYERNMQICGGTIISLTAVISAAHCWDMDTPGMSLNSYQIRAGSSYRSFGGIFYDISRLVIHRGWNNVTTSYDFALVRIRKSFELTETVAISPLVTEEPPVGAMVKAVGWGSTPNSVASEDLYEVQLIIIGREACKRQMPQYVVTKSMLCAGYPAGGKDTCTGDSGGPLYYNNKLAGITSWGVECGAQTPGIYSNIAHITGWIQGFV